MSMTLLALARRFVAYEIGVGSFVDSFFNGWKKERDSGEALRDARNLSEALSTIFSLIDLYNPAHDRLDHEIDEPTLRHEIERVLLKNVSDLKS